MRKQRRQQLPKELAAALKSRRMSKGGKWPKFQKKPINEHLRPYLLAQAANRCSYCGFWRMGQGASYDSIDHFKPKSKFPALALEWTNLLLACDLCQGNKGEKWPEGEEELLDPSAPEYEFFNWFYWDINEAKLEPRHPEGTPEHRRAKSMIDTCDINRDGVTAVRRRLRTKSAVANYHRKTRGEDGTPLSWNEGDWPFL